MPRSIDEWARDRNRSSGGSVGSSIVGAVGGKTGDGSISGSIVGAVGGQSGGSVGGSIAGAVQQQTGQSGGQGSPRSIEEWAQDQQGSRPQTLDEGQRLYEQRKQAQAEAKPWMKTLLWLGEMSNQAEQARLGQQIHPQENATTWEDVKDAWEASRKANRAADYAGRDNLIKEYNAARHEMGAQRHTPEPEVQRRYEQARDRLYEQERIHGNIGLNANGELQTMSYSFGEGVGNVIGGTMGRVIGGVGSAATWLGEAAARSEYAKSAANLREMAAFYAMTGNDNASEGAYRMADTLTQRAAQRGNLDEFGGAYDFFDKQAAAGNRLVQAAKENQRPVVQMGVDVGSTALEMGFDAVSGSPLVSMGVRVFGGASQEAREAGAGFLQQGAYGAASASIEVMTEMIGGLKLYGGGQLDEVLEPALREIAGTPGGYALLRAMYTMAQEGNEEVLSDLLQPIAQSIYNGQSVGENYSQLELQDILYDWLLGAAAAFGGAVVESGGYAQDYTAMREMQQDLNAQGVETGRMTNEQLRQAYILDKAGVNVAGLQSAENRAVGGETIGEAYENMTPEQRQEAVVNMLTANAQQEQTPTDEITRETAQEILRESLGEREAESAERILDLGSESNLREQAIAYHAIATEYGQTEGRSVEDALRSNVRGALNDTQVQHAYAYGESLRKSGQTVGVNGQTTEQGAQTANPVRRAGLVTAGTFADGSNTYKAADLSKADARELTILKDIAKAQGVDIVLYETELGEADAEGRRSFIGANGAYRNGVVYLDINAGLSGERTEGGKTYSIGQRALLVTAAHELTHHLEHSNPTMYRQLRSFVTERLGGSDSFIGYVKDAMAREDISVEAASREVVARACEEVLLDEDAIREMQGKKPTLWEQIKEWVKDFVKKFESASGEAVEMRQYANELRRLWLDTATQSAETPTDLRGDVVPANAPAVDPANAPEETFTASGANGQQYSLRSMSHDIAEGKMFADLRQYCGWTQAQTDTLKKNLQGLVQYMSQYAGIVDMNESYDKGNRPYSAYKPNSDPLYTISLDFSTLCRKRLLTQHIMEQLQLQLIDAKSGKQGRILTAEEQMAIRDMLEDYAKQEKALKVACAMCYVEAARLKAPAQMERIIGDMGSVMIDYYAKQSDLFKGQTRSAQNRWKVEHGYSATDTKAAMTNKDRSAFNKFSKEFRASYTPTAAEMEVVERARDLPRTAFLSAENLTRLYTDEQTRDIYKAYTNKLRESTHSKGLETDIPYYYGDSAEAVSDTFIRNVVAENGMRFSSWSDFQMKHVLDMMTAVIELSTRKCSMHGYTKFLDAVRLFGKTGMMFNMSGVPAGNGFTADGQLAFSKTESVLVYGENGEYDAIRARREFPETAGLQCIGISRAHILALLDSDIIDYIIPYHTSGLNAKLRKMAGINNWDDFQGFQQATVDKSIEQGNCPNDIWHKEPVFSEFFAAAKDPANGYKEGEAGIDTMRRAAEQYKQMCRERGLRPKFSWANSKVDANFSDHPDYWKLLIDRKMINQETGKLIEQKPVEPNFDFAEIKRAVKEEVESYDPSLEDRALDYIKGHLDELPGRVKDLKARGSQNAHEAQRPTTMDRHMMDMQNGLYAAEASGLRNPSVTARAESSNATETEYNGKITQHSLRGVEPVEPKSDAWKRGFTADEVREKYAGFRKSDAKNPYVEDSGKSYKERKAERIRLAQREKAGKRGNGTQRANTAPTYDRLYDTLEHEGFKGTILDASSGLGIGTDHGIQRGFDVEDIEPFYGEGYRPIFSDYSRLNKQYDVVISSAVINVLTQDDSDAMVAAIGNALKPGGRAFITVRSASSVDGSLKGGESKRLSQSAHEWVVPGSDNYQRGFETEELRAYLEDVLGPGFTVESSPKFYDKNTGKWQKWGDTSAVVTRNTNEETVQRSVRDLTSKVAIDTEIARLQDQIRDIQNAQWNANEAAKKDPRVQAAQEKMWAAEDANGRAGSVRERMEYRRILKQVKEELNTEIPEGDLNELAQRVTELKELREQFLKVTPITKAQYDKLAKHFGTTTDYEVAGFILQDGRMLDFSGKKQYGNDYAGGREVYHNEVGDVLNLPTDTSPRIDMVSNGNIRLVPEINGINLSQAPTAQQKDALRGFIEYHKGNVHVDIDNAAGRTIESFGYYNGTSTAKILADIDNYFKTGATPAPVSDLRTFFSVRSDAMTDREILMLAAERTRERMDRYAREEGPEPPKQIKPAALARILQDKSGTDMGLRKLAERIQEIADADVEQQERMAAVLAGDILDETRGEDGRDGEIYRELRARLSQAGLRISDELRGDIADFEDWRRRNGLKLHLRKDGMPIDSFYDELRGKYPGVFPEELAHSDMVQHILDALEGHKPGQTSLADTISKQEYRERQRELQETLLAAVESGEIAPRALEGMSEESWASLEAEEPGYSTAADAETLGYAVEELTRRLQETQQGMFADKELAQFRDAMARYQDYDEAAQEHLQKLGELQTERKTVTDMRTSTGEITPQEKQQRLDALDKQIASERKEATKAEQNAARALSRVTQLEKGRALQDILVKERAAQRQRTRDKANERLLKRDARKAVEKRAKVLYDMLMKNSDKQHVPEMLKEPLGAFLQGLDFSSNRLLAGGEETKRDAKFGAALQKISTMLNDQQAWINGDEKAKNGDFGAYLDISGENLKFLKDCSELVTEALSENQTYTINQMSGKDLKALSGFLMNLTTAIRNMNNFMANARYESVREAAETDIEHMKALGRASERAGSGLSKTAMWDNGVPYYVLKRFGEGSKAIFDSFAKGWEKLAFNAKEIIDFTEKLYTTKEVNAWKSEMHDFTLEDGNEIRMTTAQVMALSAMIGREQAMKHIEQGGIRIGDIQTKKGEIHDTTHYHFTAADISAIVGTLTERQAEVAGKLQKFMAKKGAEWGNEVSMKRFGYRFYTEGDAYYPIKTDSNDRPMADTDAQENSMFRLLNLSSSKPLEPNASNALIVDDIFDTFADHMADMAKLNGMGLPVLDAIKWFNYRDRIDRGDGTYDTNTLQSAMEHAFGKQAQSYFRTLIKDINGVKESGDRGGEWQGKLISNYKIAAVGNNLRVMLLQPTSYVRALTLIKPQYLAGALFSKNAYKEALKYSGTAVWKALGYYDTNISRSMREQIQHSDSFGDQVKEISMTGAEFGDKWTWGGLWVACKMQTRAEKGLSGEALNQATADLFRDVIYSSQVMDSTLTRSQSMRASGKFTKLKTAFMAEPTLSYNILLDAYSQTSLDIRKYGRSEGWKRNTGKMAHAFAVYAISASFSALVESFADALRDDDDEEFVDKFLDALIGEVDKAGKRALLKGNLMQDLTIIGKIPELKDLISLFQGYGSRDMSVTAIGELKDAYEVWRETVLLQKGILDKATKTTYYGNMTLWGKIYKTLTALSHLSGYAVSNLTRDALSLWNTFVPSMKIKTYEGRGAAAQAQRYIEAYRAGDRDKMKEIVFGVGTDKSGFNSQLSAEIRTEYMDGDISEAQAIRMLRELRGLSNLDAQDKLREWEFEKTQGYAYDKLKQTYLSGDVSEAQAMKFLRETGDKTQGEAERTMREWKFEKTHGYPYSDLKGRYVDGKVSQADTIRYVQEVTLNGLPDVKETVLHWQCLKDTGIEYDKIDERLQGGDITLDRAAGLWQKYGGMSQEDAKLKANYVAACGASAGLKDKLTQGQYKAWYNYARSAGVKVEVYADIRSTANTDEQSNISQSEAAAAITRALNSGQITRAQAEAIWKSFNKSWTTTYADYAAKHK